MRNKIRNYLNIAFEGFQSPRVAPLEFPRGSAVGTGSTSPSSDTSTPKKNSFRLCVFVVPFCLFVQRFRFLIIIIVIFVDERLTPDFISSSNDPESECHFSQLSFFLFFDFPPSFHDR